VTGRPARRGGREGAGQRHGAPRAARPGVAPGLHSARLHDAPGQPPPSCWRRPPTAPARPSARPSVSPRPARAPQKIESGEIPRQKGPNGIEFVDVVVGTGASPATGFQVVANYVAMVSAPGGTERRPAPPVGPPGWR